MESYLINAKETMQLLGVSEGMAYKIIAQCNQELAKGIYNHKRKSAACISYGACRNRRGEIIWNTRTIILLN